MDVKIIPDDFRDMASALTLDFRSELSKIARSPTVMGVINAPELATLMQISKTITVSEEGKVKFANDKHELQWKAWEYGTSSRPRIPISDLLEKAILATVDDLVF